MAALNDASKFKSFYPYTFNEALASGKGAMDSNQPGALDVKM